MTDLQRIRNELADRWEPDITGRSATIPTPYITLAGEDSQASLKKGDIIVVRDGGTQTKEPASLGYDAESTETFVQLDIRTVNRGREQLPDATSSPGRTRLFGYLNEQTGSEDRWGGLVGEASRAVLEFRTGISTYDIVEIQNVQDVSEQEGQGYYRALVTIRIREVAEKIDTSV